jgi:hypothetical protein
VRRPHKHAGGYGLTHREKAKFDYNSKTICLHIQNTKLILAVFLAATTHSSRLKRDMNYDIDTIPVTRYNGNHEYKHTTQQNGCGKQQHEKTKE